MAFIFLLRQCILSILLSSCIVVDGRVILTDVNYAWGKIKNISTGKVGVGRLAAVCQPYATLPVGCFGVECLIPLMVFCGSLEKGGKLKISLIDFL